MHTRRLISVIAILALVLTGLMLATHAVNAQAGGIEASEDAHLRKKAPGSPAGPNDASLILRGVNNDETWSIVKFTSVTAGDYTLTIRVTQPRSGTISLSNTTSGWAESTVTWNNKPTLGSLVDTENQPASAGDVTFTVGTLAAGTHSFYLQASNGQSLTFVASSEHATLNGPTLNPTTPPTTTTTTTTVAPTTTTEPPPGGCEGGTLIETTDTIQTVLNANPAGLFCLEDGRYRQGEITPGAGDTIQGTRNAIVDGTKDVTTGWVADSGRWKLTGQTFNPTVITDSLSCANSPAACHYADLFGNGNRLERVLTNTPGAGQWGWDYGTDTVWLGSDPAGYTSLELSQFNRGFTGGQDWTLKGFTVAKFANSGIGEANPSGHDGITLDGIESRYNHVAGWHVGTDDDILNSFSTHNGKYGFTCGGGENSLVQNTEVSYANDLYFNSIREGGSWDEGAWKCVYTTGLVMDDIHSHHNFGHGGWTDINNRQLTVKNSLFEYNWLHGYFHEISCSADIFGNIARNNGQYNFHVGFPKLVSNDTFNFNWEGAGISVTGSRDTEVYGNTVQDNVAGITLVEDGRRNSFDPQVCDYQLTAVRVGAFGLNDVGTSVDGNDSNDVRMNAAGIAAGYFFGQEAQTQNNLFVDNDYDLVNTNDLAFNWWSCSCDNRKTWSQWSTSPISQDAGGSVS